VEAAITTSSRDKFPRLPQTRWLVLHPAGPSEVEKLGINRTQIQSPWLSRGLKLLFVVATADQCPEA
jgi:hypothetical protein